MKTPVTIEKGIPIPEGYVRRRAGMPYMIPWDDMRTGDSFQVPEEFEVRLKSLITYRHRTYDARYTTRAMGDHIRVWRVS